MKLLFDTNIILDVMLLRAPFYRAATQLISEVERKKINGYICATTVTTIYYLISKVKKKKEATQLIKNLLQLFNVTQVNKSILESALHSTFEDFEDSVIHESALRVGLDGIVTRNRKDYRNSSIPIFDPEEILKIISSSE